MSIANSAADYPSASLISVTPNQVASRFRRLLGRGCILTPQGSAKDNPSELLSRGYTPKYQTSLFDLNFYLAPARQNEDIRFMVAYTQDRTKPRRIYPRLFYKDVSLTWRSASHYIRSDGENWIGKGDVRTVEIDGVPHTESDEATTDLPLELQSVVEQVNRSTAKVRYDRQAVGLVLRQGHDDRIEAYADFTRSRKKAASDPANLVHGGKTVARFQRKNDPTSLRIVKGYEPDFKAGIAEQARLSSSLYGNPLMRFRILSSNRKIQYLFVKGPAHCWIASVQATSTALSTYGVRLVDAVVDDNLLLPGYEFHYIDEHTEPPQLYSQIPKGFAGPSSSVDPSRADASAWLKKVPVIEQFIATLGAG